MKQGDEVIFDSYEAPNATVVAPPGHLKLNTKVWKLHCALKLTPDSIFDVKYVFVDRVWNELFSRAGGAWWT